MAHRVNIMLDNTVWGTLKKVPAGERSKIVNAAVAEWFKSRRRQIAARKMDALREAMPVVSTQEIVAWLRRDREARCK